MKVFVVASKEYADLGFIRHLLSATHGGDGIEVLHVIKNDNNGNKVAVKWAEDMGIKTILCGLSPLEYNAAVNECDVVIVFAAGTIIENNIARHAISTNKQLHVFQNPLELTS